MVYKPKSETFFEQHSPCVIEKRTGYRWHVTRASLILGHLHHDILRRENGLQPASIRLCEQGVQMRFHLYPLRNSKDDIVS